MRRNVVAADKGVAALQGLVALANNGMLDGTPLTETLDEVVERLVLGLRPR